MPFRSWPRWKSEPAPPVSLAEKIERLAADPRVHCIFDWFSRNEREIASFQLAITSIPAPPFGEQERALWLGQRLEPLGLSLTTDVVGNLIASRPAYSAAPQSAVALSAHLDTVFPASTPIHVRREQARLLGPGISDNGAGLSALWALAAAFHECAIATAAPLLFIGNVGEEGEGNLRGMRHLYRQHLASASAEKAENAVNDFAPPPEIACLLALDGAGMDNIIAQALGSRRFEVVFTGPGGHSWSDYGAPNPIVAAALAVESLSRIALPANPRTTLNVGAISGGTSINTIPDRAVLKIDIRSTDSRRLDELEQQLRRAIAEACAETVSRSLHTGSRLQHQIAVLGERPAGELAAASPLLAAVRAVDSQLGIRSQILRASTDANIPLSLGLEAVTLGAGGSGGGVHTVHEWYDPARREQALKRLTLIVLLLAGLTPVLSDSNSPAEHA